MNFELKAIGIVHSPFKEKFGTPRQPGLIPCTCSVELLPPYNDREAFQGIEQFSHLWVSFIFHQNSKQGWAPRVRPPRLGGNKTIGVFASRSPNRPNPLGLSVVELTGLREDGDKLYLDIKGADMVEGTPVLDIKPYIPYSDSIGQARAGYAEQSPQAKLEVVFSEIARQQLQLHKDKYPQLEEFISQVIALDPRPAYKTDDKQDKTYGVKLFEFDVQWQISDGLAKVTSLDG